MKKRIQQIFTSLLFVFVGTAICACAPDSIESEDTVLTDVSHGSLTNHHVVATGDAINVTHNSATILCSANINYKGELRIEPGIIYSTDKDNVSYKHLNYVREVKVDDFTSSEYEVTLNDLAPSRTYYYRAYASSYGYNNYHFGEMRSFTTSEKPITQGDAVDLGLSVKWSSLNIGADQPEENGMSYYWGYTTASTSKDWHEFSISTLNNQGYIDDSNNLCPSHDTATDKWGSSWRMPTKEEIQELRDECTWKEVKKNGKDVFLITGPNSNVIYLPIAKYWSSTGSSNNSYYLEPYRYYSYNPYSLYISTGARGSNFYIRPVHK